MVSREFSATLRAAAEDGSARPCRPARARRRWHRCSYYRVGQTTAFGGVEAEREGHVHFAGEHTTQEWRGFLQGAVFTGQRAANSVLEALGYKGGGRIKPLTMVR